MILDIKYMHMFQFKIFRSIAISICIYLKFIYSFVLIKLIIFFNLESDLHNLNLLKFRI
jgi:hypothetical protein